MQKKKRQSVRKFVVVLPFIILFFFLICIIFFVQNTYGIPMTLSWGMCLPESCHAQDLEGLLNLGTCAFTLLSSVGRHSPRLFFTFSTGFEPSTRAEQKVCGIC